VRHARQHDGALDAAGRDVGQRRLGQPQRRGPVARTQRAVAGRRARQASTAARAAGGREMSDSPRCSVWNSASASASAPSAAAATKAAAMCGSCRRTSRRRGVAGSDCAQPISQRRCRVCSSRRVAGSSWSAMASRIAS
jgi:hypothetical protein